MGSVNKQAATQVVIKIDKDYLDIADRDSLGIPSRVGLTWEAVPGFDYDNFTAHQVADGEKVRFRILDDDGEVYYGGWLLNDSEGINQFIVLRWAERDAGATEIQVKINDEWKTEIG